jgi:diguanylate cyclase
MGMASQEPSMEERLAGRAALSARPASLCMIAGTTLAVINSLGWLGSFSADAFLVLCGGAFFATLIGLRRNRPSVRWPWMLIAVGILMFLVGGEARLLLHTLGDLSPHRSLVPDLITIPGYLVVTAGVIGIALTRTRGDGDDIDTVLDGVIAALAVLSLAWVILVQPALSHAHAPLSTRLTLAVYPPVSVLLVVIAAQLVFGGRERRVVSFEYLLMTMACFLAGDTLYMLVELHKISAPPGVIDLPYGLGFVAFIGTVLHPSIASVTTRVSDTAVAPRGSRLLLVAIALAIPAVLAVTRSQAAVGDRIALAVIVLLLTTAAVTRMIRAMRAQVGAKDQQLHQALHDSLTGLPNRAYIERSLMSVAADSEASSGFTGLLLLGLDRFKLVNDTHGHTFGDLLLLAATQRLQGVARPGDVVGRIGGDEFVMLLKDLPTPNAAWEIAERVRSAFSKPFEIRETEIDSRVSVGLVVESATTTATAENMIRDADIAMHRAKDGGRDTVRLFEPAMRDESAERLGFERDLRRALARDELHLQYQPVVSLATGQIQGFEALLRWTHPVRGSIAPVQFIPVAEETGEIVEIGGWVLEQACRQLVDWRREIPGGKRLDMAVNVSVRQLMEPDLVDRVTASLEASKLPPDALVLEITESMVMENWAIAEKALAALHALGVRVAIDDFGTGYSALAYLDKLAGLVDIVKVDKTFVDKLEQDDKAKKSAELIVRWVANYARQSGLTTVAEGVESVKQGERLRGLGCQLAQGYYFSRPVNAEDMTDTAARLGVGTTEPALSLVEGGKRR